MQSNVDRSAEALAELARDEDIRELAKPAEYPTTKNDYAGYMHKIQQLATMGKLPTSMVAVMLIAAGGSVEGIEDAYRCLTGESLRDKVGGPR